MKLIVLSVSPETLSKYSGFPTKRVTFKSLDPNDKNYYYLNLDEKFKEKVSQWDPVCKEGNVLDVTLQANGKNINLFQGFTHIKKEK